MNTGTIAAKELGYRETVTIRVSYVFKIEFNSTNLSIQFISIILIHYHSRARPNREKEILSRMTHSGAHN